MDLRGWFFGAVAMAALPASAAEIRFVSIDAAPWAFYDAHDRPAGAFAEIVAELGRRSGHTLPIALQSFARIERDLELGAQDCTIILWMDSRARLVEMGEAIYSMPFGIVARKGVPLTRYDDLLPLRVSMVKGVAFDKRFEADDRITRDLDKDYGQSLQKLAHGRVDAVSGAIPTILHQIRRAEMDDQIGDILELSRIPLALQCSKTSPQLPHMAGLGAVIRAMKDDGTVSVILARHGYR
jgi:polar amino acid transport system substrate-binding protein